MLREVISQPWKLLPLRCRHWRARAVDLPADRKADSILRELIRRHIRTLIEAVVLRSQVQVPSEAPSECC